MNLSYLFFLTLGFIAVVLLLEGLYLLWSDTRSPELLRVRKRLESLSPGDLGQHQPTLVKQRLLSQVPLVHQLLSEFALFRRLDRLIVQAGSEQSAARWLLVCLSGALAGLVLGLLLGRSGPGAVAMVVLGAGLPLVGLMWMRTRRLEKMQAQLPDVLDLICRALRAGHAFSAALAMVGNEAREPIAREFKTTFDEINFGISTRTALLNLAERAPIPDMRYFVLAVVIQLETGGNLTGLLTMLAGMIRERFKLKGKVSVLAAEGRLSAYILTALPFFVAGLIQIVNPGYLAVLFSDPTGQNMVIGALVMMALGIFALWRITDIRV